MSKALLTLAFSLLFNATFSQNVGILRKNYFTTVYDSILNISYDVYDSSTIRLGSIEPLTGNIIHLNNTAYTKSINLTGATIDPYQNKYYIGSGFNFLTFDINNGNLLNEVPISGGLTSAAFQNFRFNLSDSILYGMIPDNFYSTYFDSLSMTNIQVLDSSHIRFASIDPSTGIYTLIGNTPYRNIYTLAGNSIDPFQMIYYYSAVDTIIGIDLYTGAPYSIVPVQLPNTAIFENIAYSCADTSIYGLTRQNYTSVVYDSLLMMNVEIIDSTTFRLSKIDPATGVVTLISPYNLQMGGNLTGGAFIDPNSMTYFFNHGNDIVGVSMITGLITSMVAKNYPAGEIAFDMMRSTRNCYGAARMRYENTLSLSPAKGSKDVPTLFPNPVQNEVNIVAKGTIASVEIMNLTGQQVLFSNSKSLNVSQLPSGIYFARITTQEGLSSTQRFIKE